MPLLYWKDEYAVHGERLDDRNKRLFFILNSVYDNVISSWNLNYTLPLIDELLAYSVNYFSSEEQFMRVNVVTDLDDKIESTTVFIQAIEALKTDYINKDLKAARDRIIFLIEWFLHHILKVATDIPCDTTGAKTQRGTGTPYRVAP